jgi:hypothetical protein
VRGVVSAFGLDDPQRRQQVGWFDRADFVVPDFRVKVRRQPFAVLDAGLGRQGALSFEPFLGYGPEALAFDVTFGAALCARVDAGTQ